MRRFAFAPVLLAVAWAAIPRAAEAQRGFTPCDEAQDSPQGRDHPLCKTPRKGFSLFGLADNAVAGLRTVTDVTFAVASSTPGDRTALGNQLPVYLRGTPLAPTTNIARFFEYHFYQAASRTDYLRARDSLGIASLQNVRGGGYSFATNSSQYGGPDLFTGHDGSLGSLYEGVNSEPGSCRDMSFSFLGAGLKLLAISDCPETWPAGVWRGSPHFNEESWLDYLNRVGPAEFTFDFWKVGADFADPDRRFIGTSAQTYAISSDHGRETRAAFGNVIRANAPDPRFEGYPLGLDWEWDAMTFNVSGVARMQVLQAKIINNSAEVYGTGIDYDSLYVGLQTRWLHAPPSNGRRASPHSLPQYGAIVANELGRTSNCDNARWPVGAFFTCSAVTAQGSRGFRNGATGIIYLKSPIGDLRNKKFSDPNSPFFNPTHPLAGDTITFNRMSMCGFECANIQFVDLGVGTGTAQRAFGTIAAKEREALGGRAPQDITNIDYFYLFKPANGFENRVNLTNPRGGGGFNYCAVEGWRYTNRPKGAPTTGSDTLFFDDCNPSTNTITALWSDTLPDRSMNMAYNNTWSGAGPFPLKAGDTTALVFAIITAPDSAQFMQLLQNAYDFYLDFYLGPGSPSPARIQYAQADSGIAGLAQNRVTLYLDYTEVFKADPSIPNTLNKLANAPATTADGRVVRMNPWLLDSIRIKAPRLVDSLYIFKSCNGGRTFTATQTRGVCPADRAQNASGGAIGTGWRAYATLTRDAAGNFPSRFIDTFVSGGQRYLYTIVAHRAPLAFTVVDSGVVNGTPTLVTRTFTVLEESSSSLSTNRSAPNVVEVYVPVSAQTGASAPLIARSISGPTGNFAIDSAAVVAVAPFDSTLDYTAFFGDSLTLVTYDDSRRTAVDSTVLLLYRSARVGFGANSAAIRAVRDTLIFRAPYLLAMHGGTPARTETSRVAAPGGGESDSVVVIRRTFRQFTSVVAKTGTTLPFFASAALASTTVPFQPPEALSLPGAPPLIFTIANRLTGSLQDTYWREPGFSRVRSIGTPTVTFDASRTTPTGAMFGEYVFRFADSEFGPLSPFTIDPTNPSLAAERYAESLRQRVRADTTSVSQATVDVINASLGTSYTTSDLARLFLPFVAENVARDSSGQPVTIAVLKGTVPARAKLGVGLDTIGVAVPDSVWVPGTPMIFIEWVPVARVDATTGAVLEANGELVADSVRRVTFRQATIACLTPTDGANLPRLTCNPVRGLGATGHVHVRAQQEFHARFDNPLTAESQIRFRATPALVGRMASRASEVGLDDVKAVPNPYVFQNAFEQGLGVNARRLLFTHVPPQGRIRIFTAAGAFVQEISWTPEMLSSSGDIFWDMRTREGYEAGAGLYLFTVEATGAAGGAKRKRPGKFIIIK